MEKKRLGLYAASTLLVGATLFAETVHPEQYIMNEADARFRDSVLVSYNFTPDAVSYLSQVPFFNRNKTTNGGGYSHDWPFPYAEVFSHQDEAAVHEMSEVYFNHLYKNDSTFGDQFIRAVAQSAAEDKTDAQFVHNLVYGIEGTDFKGIPLNFYTEYWGSIASGYMGKLSKMPKPLQPFFASEFVDDSLR